MPNSFPTVLRCQPPIDNAHYLLPLVCVVVIASFHRSLRDVSTLPRMMQKTLSFYYRLQNRFLSDFVPLLVPPRPVSKKFVNVQPEHLSFHLHESVGKQTKSRDIISALV